MKKAGALRPDQRSLPSCLFPWDYFLFKIKYEIIPMNSYCFSALKVNHYNELIAWWEWKPFRRKKILQCSRIAGKGRAWMLIFQLLVTLVRAGLYQLLDPTQKRSSQVPRFFQAYWGGPNIEPQEIFGLVHHVISDFLTLKPLLLQE